MPTGVYIPSRRKWRTKTYSNPAFEEWHTQDQIALAWLLNSVSDSIVTITSKLTTSASVWSFLTNAYAAYSIAPLGTNYRVAFSLHQPQEPPTHFFYQTISPAETTHQHPHSANKARWARRKQPKCQICLQFGHEAIHCRERYNPNFLPSSPTTALPPQPGVTAGGTWSPNATHYIINSEPQQSGVHSYSSPVIIEYQGQNYLQPDPIQGWAYGEEDAEYYSGNESEGEHYPGDEWEGEYYLEEEEEAEYEEEVESLSRLTIVG